MNPKAKDWTSSVIAGVIYGLVISALGAPVWAAVGFGYLGFLIWRVGDKLSHWG